MKNKEDITKILVDILEIDISQPKNSLDDLTFKWWATGRTGSGLRLTEEGNKAFTDAEIEFFEFPLFKKGTDNMKANEFKTFTLRLGKRLNCPFYIGIKNTKVASAYIRVYDSKIAMMIELYGSFTEYLNANRI